MSGENRSWNEANQVYLMAAIKVVQKELELFQLAQQEKADDDNTKQLNYAFAQQDLEKAAQELPTISALETVVKMFGLSTFERKILLMCAGIELDSNFSQLIASLQDSPSHVHPTFSLALAVFPDAHWSAISPNSPLRYWHLIDVNNGTLLTKSALSIDEHLLHYITGIQYLNERLKEILVPVFAENNLVPSQQALAENIMLACSPKNNEEMPPVIELSGNNKQDKPKIAAAACAGMGFHLYSLSVFLVPPNMKEISELIRSWNREAALNSCALLLDYSKLDLNDKLRIELVTSFIENIQGLLILVGEDWSPQLKRQKVAFKVLKPTSDEQLELWKKTLGDNAVELEGYIGKVASHFNLSSKTIEQATQEVLSHQPQKTNGKDDHASLKKIIWKACCVHTRLSIDELAQRIEPVARWDDIVLPNPQKQTLKEISTQVKHRNKVYKEWGFANMGARGLGISALFTGESGTGKTMAAEVLANELQLDLYRIDLSQVVNKYIGETEKNLKRIFDAAEEGGAILLFDEADALFGKRSDVKDSHDRYSNIEVSYLLQRMEAYSGLAVLTTNLKSSMDKAFLRRIRFVVQFPYPDAQHRAEIWRKVFPANTPVKDLDMTRLSNLSVPGGNIRNIAINAAFMAADEGQPVQMHHVSQAARSEYTKLDKAMNNI